ncbi:MAG TPA: lysophospholipid acyltransferase family protein [Herpetosiphonaceae bacterium]
MQLASLLAIAARIVPHVPPRLGYTLCEQFGAAVGPRVPAWTTVLNNLQVIMPTASPAQREIAARGVMIGMFKNYFDLFRFPSLPPAALDQHIVIEGAQNVERALARGKGLLMVAPHCGNYTIIFAPAIRRFNTRVLLIVEQIRDPRLHQIMNRMREMPGIEIEPLGPNAGRAIIRTLRRNEIVLLGGDRAIAENNLTVNFFGRPTPMPSGPATLALRTGAPIMTAFTNRLPDNRSWAMFDPPLLIERSGSLQDDVCDVTQKIAYIMQAYIRRDPAQWLVADPVWPNV